MLAAVIENSESFMLTENRGLLRIFESLQMSLLTGFNISMTFYLQACIGASRLKYKLKKELSKWDKTKCFTKISMRRVGKFAADIPVTLFF